MHCHSLHGLTFHVSSSGSCKLVRHYNTCVRTLPSLRFTVGRLHTRAAWTVLGWRNDSFLFLSLAAYSNASGDWFAAVKQTARLFLLKSEPITLTFAGRVQMLLIYSVSHWHELLYDFSACKTQLGIKDQNLSATASWKSWKGFTSICYKCLANTETWHYKKGEVHALVWCTVIRLCTY